MADLDRRLAALGEMPAEPPPLPELEQRARRVRRRRQARRATGALVAVVLGLALWDLSGGLGAQRVDFHPADGGRAGLNAPSEWPLGVVVTDRDGVVVVPFDAPDESITLRSDAYYEGVAWAFSDQQGGLIFRHDVTPPPWPPGAVLWLRSGATRPELLVPPVAPSEADEAAIVPVGMATAGDGHALFVYAIVDYGSDVSTIMAADLSAGGVLRVLSGLDGRVDAMWGRYDATVGGDVVALVDRQVEDCPTVTLLRVDDGSRIPSTPDCLPGGPWDLRALSHDGRSLGSLPDPDGDSRLTATVTDLATGATLHETPIRLPDGFLLMQLHSSPGGWAVYVETSNEILLQDLDGDVRVRIETSTLPLSEWRGMEALYHHRIDLASDASLSSGRGELPCQPTASELTARELPAAVAATRQALFELAAACDYESLAALAREHATLVFAHHTDTRIGELLESEGELVRSWVADGRADLSHQGIGSREPLGTLAELLRKPPVYVERAVDLPASQPQREGPVWVWPAEWVEAPTVFGSAHTDYRIGIAPDGSWRFFVAGDFTGEPPPPARTPSGR
jgi:hypothetical protein